MEIAYAPKVTKFIQDLPDPLDARAKRTLDMLETHGHALRLPYSRCIAPGLFELRILGGVQVRLLYFFHRRQAVVVHGLIKKQNKLSSKDVAYAFKIRAEILASI